LEGELPDDLAVQTQGRWSSSPAALRQAAAGRLFLLDQPLQPESASEVRRRIASREDWQELVPPPVAAFIIASGLYSSRACDPSPL
jgi:nicotinate-nucleotide adenylyltransferase